MTPNDACRYICRAENEAGTLDTVFNVEVIARPKFLVSFTPDEDQQGQTTDGGERKHWSSTVDVLRGHSITLHCPVEERSGSPPPRLHWVRRRQGDGGATNDGDDFVIQGGISGF